MYGLRTITFDLDDTLWAIGPVLRRAEEALRAWLDDRFPRIGEMHAPEDIIELRERVIVEHSDRAHDLTFVRKTVLSRMGISAGYGDGFVDDAFDVFDRERNTLELFPDVRVALESLRTRYRLIAVTNGNARLDRIGIDHLFDGFVSARTAGVAKPARSIFDTAVKAGGAQADETLHVGDHPETDIQGARAAGLRTVWVNRHGHDWPRELAQPDGVVRDLLELDRLLTQLEQAR